MTESETRQRLLDPVLFAKHFLRDDPWETQVEIFRALEKPRARVAVKGCHSSSKTYGAAEFVLWFITRYPHAIALTSAPREVQVKDVMWGEIRKAILRSRFPYPASKLMRLDMQEGNYAEGLICNSSDQAVAMQGHKAPHMLYVMDEAPGIPPEILSAIEGSAAGGDVRVLQLGNPTIPSGAFHDCFTVNRSRWQTFSIDAYDTPNFVKLREMAAGNKDAMTELLRTLPEDHPAITYELRPYLASPAWARGRLREWGEHSPLWQARVRAEFPEQGQDSLISLAWLEAAKNRTPVDDGHRLQVGIDVAGPGEDETVAIVRCGPSIIASWASAEPETIAWNACVAWLNRYKVRIDEVNIDSAGVGAGFAKQLEEDGYNVNRINVGETKGVNAEQFFLLKAQLYWGLRERFQDGDVAGLDDDLAISQLASIRYKHNARGQVVIESKDEAKKRGVKSPDRAEALMLAFADRTPGILRYYEERGRQQQEVEAAAKSAQPAPPTVSEPEEEGGDMMETYLREMKRIKEGV